MGNTFGGPSEYKGEVCDPHIHFWDFKKRPNPHHEEGLVPKLPVWLPSDYLKAAAALEPDLKVSSIVHIETIDEKDPEGETAWISSLDTKVPCKIVCFVDLSKADARGALERQAGAGAVGVRHIINKDPSWPNVREDLLANETFVTNFKALADFGLSFDAQLNPHQFERFAELVEANPKVPVMLNHLGCLKLRGGGQDLLTHDEHKKLVAADDEATELWRKGMRRLAKSDHVFVKLSMLPYTLSGWWDDKDKSDRITALVLEVIALFGPRRCCFASNYPVDLLDGFDLPIMYAKFRDMTKDMPYADQKQIFHDTAAAFYKVC